MGELIICYINKTYLTKFTEIMIFKLIHQIHLKNENKNKRTKIVYIW